MPFFQGFAMSICFATEFGTAINFSYSYMNPDNTIGRKNAVKAGSDAGE